MKKGVDYNIDNIENKKNIKNIEHEANGFLSPSVGVVSYATPIDDRSDLSSGQTAKRDSMSQVCIPQPTPLCEDQIIRSRLQMYDNGEGSSQRYKLKCTIDLVDGSRAEFIASLTKDMRNFKKYIPEEGKDLVLEVATQYRRHIKKTHSTYPYMGKFHLNQGRGRHIHSQIEPNTVAIIWFNPEDKGWSGALMIYDWSYEFDLFDTYVTEKQKQSGLKCQDIWKNPKYDKTERPLTWAEQRALK
jgi:hypothetical protein